MTKLQAIAEKVISELARIQKLPHPYKDQGDDYPFRREIGVGNGNVIVINKEIDNLIGDFSRELRADASMESRFSPQDYIFLVRSAFGPALLKVNLEGDSTENALTILNDIKAEVSNRIGWILNADEQEFAFGCTLFTYQDFGPLIIGPVQFEPREIWIHRKLSDGRRARITPEGRIERFDHQIASGSISRITRRRIMRVWHGQKLRNRQSTSESNDEHDILAAIGDCPYVCSVRISGFGGKAGQDKALLAARLALTTLSLIWQKSSKALNGMNLLFDRDFRTRSWLSFTSDGLIFGGRDKPYMPNAPWCAREDLDKHLQEFSGEFAIAGEAIEWFLNPSVAYSRVDILNVLLQAMLWFHDGCREVTDLKAIVSFASCMDILAGGDGRKNIIKLIHARLGIDGNANLHRNGATLENLVDEIYDEGRTRFIHGPRRNGVHVWSDKFGRDWSEMRNVAEWLAQRCLVSCMEWAANNPSSNDPKQFLS